LHSIPPTGKYPNTEAPGAAKLTISNRKHIDHLPTPDATAGCDFAGVVEEVGPKVSKNWKKGDRIAGFLHGSNAVEKADGCFADYCLAKGDIQMKVHDTLSDQEASTLGVGITTVGQALYQSLELPLPGLQEAAGPLFIHGGSTATGTLAIQFAALFVTLLYHSLS
jgi:NADPH:quinone reductase-like Zn-dependent oxidoreductase